MRLYEVSMDIADEIEQIMAYAEDHGLSVDEVQDTLDSIQGDFADKAEGIIRSIKNYEAMSQAKKNEMERLKESAYADQKKAENLALFLDMSMKAGNLKKVNAGIFIVQYKKGSTVVQIDEKKLPSAYFKPQPPKPWPKPELAKLLKLGTKIEGVELVQNPDKMVIK